MGPRSLERPSGFWSASGNQGPPGSASDTTTADGSGNYDFKVPGPLSPGSYSFQVQVRDKYGDVSSPSAVQTITVVPPLVTVMSVTDKTNKKHLVTQVTSYSAARSIRLKPK